MTASESTGDDVDVDEAVSEAVDSLREAYPDRDRIPDSADLEEFGSILTWADGDLHRDAVRLLSMLAEQFPEASTVAVPQLIDQLDDSEEPILADVLRALGHISTADPRSIKPAVPVITDLIEGEPPVVRNGVWTLANVAKTSPEDVEVAADRVLSLLKSGDDEVKRHALRFLSIVAETYPEPSRSAVPRVLESLESMTLYRDAGRALTAMASVVGPSLVDSLLDRLHSGSPSLREHVAWTFVSLADEHPDLVLPHWNDLYEVVLDDEDYQVRNSATATLAALAVERPDQDLLDALEDLLTHDDPVIRRYGCLALGDVAMSAPDGSLLQALGVASDDPTAFVSDEAERQLLELATEHPERVAEVRPDLLNSPSDVG